MLLVSFLLVIVATIFLLSGLFLTKDLALIFISIACSALAGIVLVVAVMRAGRGRPPSRRPTAVRRCRRRPTSPPSRRPPGRRRPAGPTAASSPIPDYDSLEVVEVLPLLGDLEPAELEMVRQREASGRAHPWILARVDALLEAEADADTSEHAWSPSPGPMGSGGQGRLLDAERRDPRGRTGRRRLGVAPRLRLGRLRLPARRRRRLRRPLRPAGLPHRPLRRAARHRDPAAAVQPRLRGPQDGPGGGGGGEGPGQHPGPHRRAPRPRRRQRPAGCGGQASPSQGGGVPGVGQPADQPTTTT